MAQLAIAAAASWLGSTIGGAVGYAALGSSIGWAVGSMLYQSSQTIRNKGAISDDLKAPKLQYGTPIPRLYGRQRIAGHLIWCSRKRPIANTTSEGGKGGPKIENTSYTYEVDAKFMLYIDGMTALAITRVWRGGELIYSALSSAADETLQASASTDAWAEMTLRDGNPSQMPWPIYEAAVGTENAVADRLRTTVCLERWNLGGSDQLQLLEFEVITAGTSAVIPGNVILQTTFQDESAADIIDPPASLTVTGTVVIDEDELPRLMPESGIATLQLDSVIEYQAAKLDMDGTSSYTLEAILQGTPSIIGGIGLDNTHQFLVWDWLGSTADITFQIYVESGVLRLRGSTFNSTTTENSPVQLYVPGHIAAVITPDGTRLYYNGVLILNSAVQTFISASDGRIRVTGADSSKTGDLPNPFQVIGLRLTRDELYTGSAFEPPTDFGPPDGAVTAWTPENVDLADVVEAEAERSGFDLAALDVSELVGIEVIGLAPTGSARQVLETLMSSYYFDWVCSQTLRAVLRGGASVATIAHDDLAAGVDDAEPNAFDPERANDEEIPAKIALTAFNLNADYEPGTELGDRLVSVSADTRTANLPLVMLPGEIKGRALAMVLDARAASVTAKICLTDEYGEIECTDPIIVPDRGGTNYRMRVVRETYAQGVKEMELVLDDPSALVTVGIASDERQPAIDVPLPVLTEFHLLDIPILRDGDNTPGFMAAFAPDRAGSWPGTDLYRSIAATGPYEHVVSVTDRAVFGVTSNALADWTGGHTFDESHALDVVLNGELSSSTRDAMFNDRSINVLAVGDDDRWEIVRFRTATLTAPNTYTLTGLLRGCRGTRWAMGLHEVGDTVVLLRPAGLRRVQHGLSDIGLERFYKAPTKGRALATVGATAFTDDGVALKPFAPVDARSLHELDDDIVITWRRSTRMETRHFGSLPASVPLGEASEAYQVDILDGATVVRTISSTVPTATYTSAQQTADGLTPGDPVDVRIYQMSEAVGRGYALEATV